MTKKWSRGKMSNLLIIASFAMSLLALLNVQIFPKQSENVPKINVATFNATHLAENIFLNINEDSSGIEDYVFGIDCESMPNSTKIFCTVTSRYGSVIYIYKNDTGIELKEFVIKATSINDYVEVTQFNGLDKYQSELQINAISEIFQNPFKRLNDV